MFTKRMTTSLAMVGVFIWILSSIYLSKLDIFKTTYPNDVEYTPALLVTEPPKIPHMLPELIPNVSSIIPHQYDYVNIPSSMHTIPSLFIISVPKSGSSSLIRWLVDTKQIFGDYTLIEDRVENNVLAQSYAEKVIIRNASIGFYLSDEAVLEINDWKYIKRFTRKPANYTFHVAAKWIGQKDKAYDMRSLFHGPKSPNRALTEFNLPTSKKHAMVQALNASRFVNRESFMREHSANQSYYTVAKSVFYFHLPYMARVFAIKYQNTKILITLRHPIHRLKSNFLFFIGDERTLLPKWYGNVNAYLQHIMQHELLKQPFDQMKRRLRDVNEATHTNASEWYEIFRVYRVFLMNMIRVCKQEFGMMGYREIEIVEMCKETDLIRSAFGTSCYIVPVMYWFSINLNAKRNFRLLQAELMFARPNEYVTRILCWVQMDHANCNQWKDKQWKTNTQWRQSEAKGNAMDINKDLKLKIKTELLQCNVALEQFIENNPTVQLSSFNLALWD
eukprot:72175_1